MNSSIERLKKLDPTHELKEQITELQQQLADTQAKVAELEAELAPPEPDPEINHAAWAKSVTRGEGDVEIDHKLHALLMERSWKARLPVVIFVGYLNRELQESGSALRFVWPGEDEANSGASS